MKSRVLAAALTLSCALPLAAEPLSEWHFGITYSDARFTAGNQGSADVNNLNLKIGKQKTALTSWEVHFGTDVASDDDDAGEGVTYLAAVLRRDIELKQTRLYGMLGLAAGTADYGDNYDKEFAGLALGLGIELFGSPQTALNAEYLMYGAEDNYKTIGLGITHYFDWDDMKP